MRVRLIIAGLALAMAVGASPASAAPLIRNPAMINIGFVCRWQQSCMNTQQRAMRRALSYVRKARPPVWKIQQCNRNAARGRSRVDWIGYYNCIRNPRLKRRR